MESELHSAGSQPAPDNNVQHLNALHVAPTCGKCPELDKRNGTLDGYKWCKRYERYTKPEHVGC